MLYVIKLIYAWLLPPGLFMLALLAVCVRCRRTVKFSKVLPVLLLMYALSIGAVSDRFIKTLENQYPQPELSELQGAQAIVVLGGGSFGGVLDFDGTGQVAAGAANRHLMGLRLHRALHVPIIFSGGLVFAENGVEADNAVRLFRACGVAEKDLLSDARSRNTAENAKFTKQICAQNGFGKVILVTSAYHMPRSVKLFRREGVDVIPYPCDYMTNKELVSDAFAFTPDHHSLSNTAIAIKEYLGILAIEAGVYVCPEPVGGGKDG